MLHKKGVMTIPPEQVNQSQQKVVADVPLLPVVVNGSNGNSKKVIVNSQPLVVKGQKEWCFHP